MVSRVAHPCSRCAISAAARVRDVPRLRDALAEVGATVALFQSRLRSPEPGCSVARVTAVPARWSLSGTVLIACNCDYGCPCNFNALPTHGHCEGGWTWHVARGRFDDVALDELNFTVMVQWPGAIHEGNGHGLVLIDARADEAQRAAIEALVGGDHGGPWGVLAWTWPTVDGPHAV